jgi:hypothetical protein
MYLYINKIAKTPRLICNKNEPICGLAINKRIQMGNKIIPANSFTMVLLNKYCFTISCFWNTHDNNRTIPDLSTNNTITPARDAKNKTNLGY